MKVFFHHVLHKIINLIKGFFSVNDELREAQKCDFGQYDEAWGRHKINCKKIIRITECYIVYIDKRGNIDWETDDKKIPPVSDEDKKNQEKLLSQCLISEHKPTGGLSDESILSFKTIVGEAIVNCLENNCDASKDILQQAHEFRIDRIVEKSREWYLTYTVTISAVLILITLIANVKNIQILDSFLEYANVGIWAVAGACLSIILRSGRMQNASYSGKKLHFIESGCRLIGGFISGQIVYLGVKSGILFATIPDANNSQYIVSFLALMAGASERFAPSIITKIEGSSFSDTTKENE